MNTNLHPRLAIHYSTDKRKRRRQHRRNAKSLANQGGGSILSSVIHWHLQQAKFLSY